jgi:hypothetical protein
MEGAMVNAKKKPKPLNDCDEKFHAWVSRAYGKLPEGQDFSLEDELLHEVWVAAWRSAYSTGIMRGQKQGYVHMQHLAEDRRKPMSYLEMADLFEGCKTGREFGLRIEDWHGIES